VAASLRLTVSVKNSFLLCLNEIGFGTIMKVTPKTRKPDWLRVKRATGDRYHKIRRTLAKGSLNTVCEAANCPNKAECWNSGTATFMLMGDVCTRGCAFCAVTRGDPQGCSDQMEPQRVADAVQEMGLDYAVLTSVTRDDLADGGASVYAETIRRIKALDAAPLVEVLIPDYLGDALDTVLQAKPAVVAHNIEVVERLSPLHRHERFSYERSLDVLRQVALKGDGVIAKSSIMLGLSETEEEIEQAMHDLLAVGVKILVLGQYLCPTKEHTPVHEYLPPETFERLGQRGRELGFEFVAAGPLVRTSYRAAEAFVQQQQETQ
jgi:lipoic acid synthetase